MANVLTPGGASPLARLGVQPDRVSDLPAYAQRHVVEGYRQAHGGDNRIAVVTTIVGGYDALILPHRPLPRADYICFSDQPQDDWGLFDIRPVDYRDRDSARSARFVKTHLPMYLDGYDIAVWIDANVLAPDLEPYIDAFLRSGKPFASIFHPQRRSVYEEAVACRGFRLDDPATIEEQMARYRREGFECDDLIETSLFIADLRNAGFGRLSSAWWSEIDRHSRRDQLSVNYALRRAGISWHPLFERGRSVRNQPGFMLRPHGRAAVPRFDEPVVDDIGQVVDPYASAASPAPAATSGSTDIVVCVHNAPADVDACLRSVHAARDGERIILVDDGSGDETASLLQAFAANDSGTTLLRHRRASGYTRAVNHGLAESTADFVVLLNSDTIVAPGWTRKLRNALARTPGAGLVGPLSNAASYQSIPRTEGTATQTAINRLPPGVSVTEMDALCQQWSRAVLPRVPLLHGFCLGIGRNVIDAIGIMDKLYFPRGYGEETDYCFRATDAGFGLVVATDTFVFHAKSKSYGEAMRTRLSAEGHQALVRKHGAGRLRRSVATMESNPLLAISRSHAATYYQNAAQAAVGARPSDR